MALLSSTSRVACSLIVVALVAIMAPCSRAQNSPQDFVDAHNAARAAVGVGPVTWDDTVAAYAQAYAEQRRGYGCTLAHSNSGGLYGENIYGGGGGAWTALDAVASWVDEKKWYDHASNTCSAGDDKCLHYTQVVWRDSTKIGCARVVCDNSNVFITCNYSPPGNYAGQSPY